jgi:hypothetical protein
VMVSGVCMLSDGDKHQSLPAMGDIAVCTVHEKR